MNYFIIENIICVFETRSFKPGRGKTWKSETRMKNRFLYILFFQKIELNFNIRWKNISSNCQSNCSHFQNIRIVSVYK